MTLEVLHPERTIFWQYGILSSRMKQVTKQDGQHLLMASYYKQFGIHGSIVP